VDLERILTRQRDDQFGFGTVNPLRALTTAVTTASGIPALEPAASGPNWLFIIGGAVLAAVLLLAGVLVFSRLRRRRRAA
jgi:uncharacterized membrane protein YdcZ (DUF606 family)